MQPEDVNTRSTRRDINRNDYPALFLGSQSTTRLLARIACEEPIAASGLIDSKISSRATYVAIRHAEDSGLIISFGNFPGSTHPRAKKHLCLNRSLPIYRDVRETLYAMSAIIGERAPGRLSDLPPTACQLQAAANVNLERLFGSETRTMAVILVALAGYLDASTIARMVGVANGNSKILLNPLSNGRVFRREPCGRLVMYYLADEPWRDSLLRLCLRLADLSPRLAILAKLAEESRDSGESPPRKYLRKTLSDAHRDPA